LGSPSSAASTAFRMPRFIRLTILQAYVNGKPDRWDYPMTFIIQDAFWKFCEE
jgi:hypothetical protein